MSATYELIAPCYFGCESTASFELRRLGAEDLRVTDGRLTFRGGAEMIAAANLNLRTVERVLLLLASYRAETFDDLFDGVYAILWQAGTLDSLLFRDEPLTGNAASAGSSSSQGMA